jgi:hypothetical protein
MPIRSNKTHTRADLSTRAWPRVARTWLPPDYRSTFDVPCSAGQPDASAGQVAD